MNTTRTLLLGAAALLLLGLAPVLSGVSGTAAQGLIGGGDLPIEIYADDGLEWQQRTQRFIARGNARAIRTGPDGEAMEVRADVLTALYRDTPGQTTEIWRLEAIGNVEIVTATETVRGDSAVYEIDQAVLVVRGAPARLETGTEVVTARDSLEYWELRGIAVARGDALAVSGERRIRADVLTAHFDDDPRATEGSGRLSRMDAHGNVVVTTPQEVARGERGAYDARTNIATLVGDVRITRGDNQLNGGYAEVNLETGVSTLYAATDRQGERASGDQGRVRGLLVPDRPPPGQRTD